VILSYTPFCVVSPEEKEKKKKRKVNINNNLAILPSYDIPIRTQSLTTSA